MSLKRQGFSSTHCTKLSLTPTRMTTTPADADSHPNLSGIKGDQLLSTAFCKASSAKKVIVLGDHDASGYAHQDVTARLGEANAP